MQDHEDCKGHRQRSIEEPPSRNDLIHAFPSSARSRFPNHVARCLLQGSSEEQEEPSTRTTRRTTGTAAVFICVTVGITIGVTVAVGITIGVTVAVGITVAVTVAVDITVAVTVAVGIAVGYGSMLVGSDVW